MLKTPDLRKKYVIIISVTLTLFLLLAVFMARSKECKVSDFRSRSPVETASSGFTKESACKKALATCALYSSWPMDCRVKE